tara:strand:- start:2605 stop:3432 length:828 start_codon:yes stop_codon:yes gene_type:complete
MTKNELIYTVYEQLKVTSDDNELSREFVSSLIDSSRATLIKQVYGSKGWNIPIEIKQELCIGLEPVSNIDGLTCFGKILRTKEKIPAGISIKGAEGAILAVRTYDRKKLNINIVPIERFPVLGHNPYTAGMLYAAIDVDSHLYFTSGSNKHMMMEAIKVEGVYQYPAVALDMQCREKSEWDALEGGVNVDTGGQGYAKAMAPPLDEGTSQTLPDQLPWAIPSPAEPWDVDYPLEAAMQDQLISMVMQKLSVRFSIGEDKFNNANDDAGAVPQRKK